MYNQTELEGRQFQLKGFAESLRMRRYSDIAVPKPLQPSNYGSIFNIQGGWLVIAPFDIIFLLK